MKNMIIGALAGYAITTSNAWEVRDNLWAVGLLSALLIWIVLKNIDDIYKDWRNENGTITKNVLKRLQRRKQG